MINLNFIMNRIKCPESLTPDEILANLKQKKESTKLTGQLIINGTVKHLIEENDRLFETYIYRAAVRILQQSTQLKPKEIDEKARLITKNVAPYILSGTASTVKFIATLLLEASLEKMFKP